MSRAGLQISFKPNGVILIGEFHGHDHLPRAVASGVGRTACIVSGKARLNVGGEANIGACRIVDAAKEVDEPRRQPIHASQKARSVPDGRCLDAASILEESLRKAAGLQNLPRRWCALLADLTSTEGGSRMEASKGETSGGSAFAAAPLGWTTSAVGDESSLAEDNLRL